MFLKSKKGDIVLQQVVLIVIAVAMILLVTTFGAKIWKSFFPSADRSTEESFNALYNVINLKTATPQSYDMTPVSLYLGKDNCVIYFYTASPEIISKSSSWSGDSIKTFYKPSLCKNKDKPCICLYDDEPEDGESERDENVILCKEIKNPINIDEEKYDFKGPVCGDIQYRNFLIIKNTISDGATKPYLYILNDNSTNRDLHKKLNVGTCPSDTTICSNKKGNEIIYPKTDDEFLKNYEECRAKDIKYATLEIKCAYNEDKKTCNVDCSLGDISDECASKYSKCDGYNQVIGPNSERYVTSNQESKDYKYYYMCNNNKKYCDSTIECSAYEFDVYAFKSSKDGSIPERELNNVLKDAIVQECKVETIKIPSGSNNYYIKYYDKDIESCKNHFEPLFFEKMSILGCIDGKLSDCKNYMVEKISLIEDVNDVQRSYDKDYELRYIQSGEIYWITHISSGRYEEAKLRFEPVYKCMNKIPI